MGMMEQDDCGGGLVDGCNGYDFVVDQLMVVMDIILLQCTNYWNA